jgi:hypothetical protein
MTSSICNAKPQKADNKTTEVAMVTKASNHYQHNCTQSRKNLITVHRNKVVRQREVWICLIHLAQPPPYKVQNTTIHGAVSECETPISPLHLLRSCLLLLGHLMKSPPPWPCTSPPPPGPAPPPLALHLPPPPTAALRGPGRGNPPDHINMHQPVPTFAPEQRPANWTWTKPANWTLKTLISSDHRQHTADTHQSLQFHNPETTQHH